MSDDDELLVFGSIDAGSALTEDCQAPPATACFVVSFGSLMRLDAAFELPLPVELPPPLQADKRAVPRATDPEAPNKRRLVKRALLLRSQ
jgi:hypothetical protein